MGLSLGLMDRELFVHKVAEFLEQYRNDPEQMEKVAAGLYKYLEEVKERMDMKDVLSDAAGKADLPTAGDIHDLKKAIEKLTEEIQNQKKQ